MNCEHRLNGAYPSNDCKSCEAYQAIAGYYASAVPPWTKDSGISCPWVWMPYADTTHGPICNSGIPAQLTDWPMPSWSVLEARGKQAEAILDEHGMGEYGPPARPCDVCAKDLDGRGDQKTCGTRCRQKLAYHCKKVEDELTAAGYEDVRERIGQDADFAEMVRQTAISRLQISPAATAAANAAPGVLGNVDHDEWLWTTQAPQPEQVVTGDQPGWQRVSRYDNPHHLRWPWRVTVKHRTVTRGKCEGFKPRFAQGPWGPFRPADRKHS